MSTLTDREAQVESDSPRDGTKRRPFNVVGALLVLLVVATFVIHVAAAFRNRSPIIYGDEGGYLGNARYLVSGHGRTGAGYQIGYSLLLVPGAWASSDPMTFFHLSLVVNAVLAAALPALGFALGRRTLPEASPWAWLAGAAALVVLPGFFVNADLVMSDNALVVLVLAVALVIAGAGTSTRRWCLAGALAGYAFWVSPRGIIVIAAFLFACAVLTRPWKTPRLGIPALGVAAMLTIVGRLAGRWITGTGHIPGVVRKNGNVVTRVFDSLLHPDSWIGVAATFFGRFAYVTVATLGFALFGIWVLGKALRRSEPNKPLHAVGMFAIPVLFLTVGFGALSTRVPVRRIDFLVYGRYSEDVLAPVLVVGVVWAFGWARRSMRRFAPAAFAIAAGGAILAFYWMLRRPARGTSYNPANVLGLEIYHHYMHTQHPLRLLAGGFVVTVGILLLMSLDRRVGAVALVLVLAFSSWVTQMRYAVPGADSRAEQRVLVDGFRKLDAAGVDLSCVIVEDKPGVSSWHHSNYRFFLPNTLFVRASKAPPDCGPVMLSATSDLDRRVPGAQPVSYENHFHVGLWVVLPRLSSVTQQAVRDKGLLMPLPVGAPLPDSAFRSKLSVTPTDMTVRNLRFAVAIRNTGTGSPWPGSWAAVANTGRVSVAAELVDADGRTVVDNRCPIPRTLFPGDSIRIACNVPTRAALSPGNYVLNVQLAQSGAGLFGDHGDSVVRVPVTLGR